MRLHAGFPMDVFADNLDERLSLDRRIGDYGLQKLTVVSRNSRINSSVSTADIMALQNDEALSKGCLMDSAFKHSRSVSLFCGLVYVT